MRDGLVTAQHLEQEIYLSVLERQRNTRGDVGRIRLARELLDQLMKQTQEVLKNITKRATDRLAEVRQTLAVEQRNIADYQGLVRTYEDDTRRMAREVGYGLIRSAERRLADILLEADLGMVDVAWQRQQDKSDAIKETQRERQGKLDTLKAVLDNLSAPVGQEEP